VFPNAQDAPIARVERAVHKPITFFVPPKFVFPECTIVLRVRAVFGAVVPETTVHENRELEFLKNKIWFAEHRLIAPPAPFCPNPSGMFLMALNTCGKF